MPTIACEFAEYVCKCLDDALVICSLIFHDILIVLLLNLLIIKCINLGFRDFSEWLARIFTKFVKVIIGTRSKSHPVDLGNLLFINLLQSLDANMVILFLLTIHHWRSQHILLNSLYNAVVLL